MRTRDDLPALLLVAIILHIGVRIFLAGEKANSGGERRRSIFEGGEQRDEINGCSRRQRPRAQSTSVGLKRAND